MGKYAEGSTVPVPQSRDELKALLRKYEAVGLVLSESDTQLMIAFEMQAKKIRMLFPLPARDTFQPTAKISAHQWYRRATMQRWRAIILIVKAKLESIEVGAADFTQEFLAYTVMDDDRTVGEALAGIEGTQALTIKR